MRRVALGGLLLGLWVVSGQFAADGSAQAPQIVSPLLVQQAQSLGTVRVIVELAVVARPEGELTTAGRVFQRQTIATSQGLVQAQLTAAGSRIVRQFETLPFIAVEVTAEGLAQLAQLPLVRSVVEDAPFAPTLADSIPIVQADDAWTSGYDGIGWAVAVLDTGVDRTHAFLSGKVIDEACYSYSTCPNGLTTQVGDGAGVPCTYAEVFSRDSRGRDSGRFGTGVFRRREGWLRDCCAGVLQGHWCSLRW